ncbi:excinuclease ABC subunit UvrA [Candidatus Uhrbacteria bacterium]|nr:excinuclease ABC subunit UvrA [Candidatus Uhrbacteria bacterium]
MKLPEVIRIQGARVHNLQNVSLELPRYQFIVITGRSGSGKSSLAFDTIYAEGQRRYVESLSTYARQFIRGFEKPDVDAIEGLSPPIAIDQRQVAHNPRSTVGTMTEIYDHLRLLYANAGIAHCLHCGQPVVAQTVPVFIQRIRKLFVDQEVAVILLPVVVGNKKDATALKRFLARQQVRTVWIDGSRMEAEAIVAQPEQWIGKTVEAEFGTLKREDLDRSSAITQINSALHLGNGVIVVRTDGGQRLLLNTSLYCERCDTTLPPFEPRNFSFNSPYGACDGCGGLGTRWIVDPQLVIPNESLTLLEGAIRPLSRLLPHHGGIEQVLEELHRRCDVPLNQPIRVLPPNVRERLLHGSGQPLADDPFAGGIVGYLQLKYATTDSEYVKAEIERTMRLFPCGVCRGQRLKPAALAVTVNNRSISEVVNLPLHRLAEFLKECLNAAGKETPKAGNGLALRVVNTLCAEMLNRLEHLTRVGLDYLTLDRSVTTLAGGEAQRIRLATQLQSHLVDLVYILDEPSVGLHQRDNARLIETLKQLRDLGNTVIVVEHDEETIRSADDVVDMGPGAGTYGGKVVAHGKPADIEKNPQSITGNYLSGRSRISIPAKRRAGSGQHLTIHHATAFNLQDLTVSIPLGELVAVTGVSGSGKSTLVDDILAKALLQEFYHAKDLPGAHERITGIEHLDKVIMIDQSPIGRTPRSNPATYTGIFTLIRDLFIEVPEAKVKGLKAGHFSFNVRGGRCEQCQGGGWVTMSMQFLPDMTVECDACEGRRYLPEILEVRWRDKNIAQILELTVQEAIQFFEPSTEWDTRLLIEKLSVLDRVGLGYLKIGQPATTLSGGEAQRIKLATELSRRSTGKTLYILDEPTTGLHADDIQKLLVVLQDLVDLGNTVVVIEHNLDVISCSDWIIDLGPDGGEGGGRLVAEGTPEELIKHTASWTGKYLAKILERATARTAHRGKTSARSQKAPLVRTRAKVS